MKPRIPLSAASATIAGVPAPIHQVPPPPKSRSQLYSQPPTLRIEDPLKTEHMIAGASAMDESDELSWSRHAGEEDDEDLEKDALLALASGDGDASGTSRVKKQARRLLALARKML